MKTTTTAPITEATAFRLRLLAMLFGCISASRSVFGPVEELLAQRGIVVTYETVRQWCGARLGRRTQTNSVGAALGVGTSGTWMRVYMKINGKTHYLW